MQIGITETGAHHAGCRGNLQTGLGEVHAMAVRFPEFAGHPNRVPFCGVLTRVDEPSDKAPSGARGHRVILTRAAAEAALPSLLGMAVDWKSGWDGHDARQKCGIITAAELDGNNVRVEGYLFARDWSDMMTEIHAHGDEVLGMSYELADAHVDDMRAQEWKLNRVTFTGAAILLRSKAAYRNTSFRVVRPAEQVAAVANEASARSSLQRLHTVRQAPRQHARPRAATMRPMPVLPETKRTPEFAAQRER